jgi:hypothetical protein
MVFSAGALFSCRSDPEMPKVTYEDGIEIVSNGLELHPRRGHANRLTMERME